ncbi:MAG: GNAT family N-acetyltransferase [Candidatus Peregrinibacteria bacterium]|nr:GNAT family N-acetyltransferase [Candidatus Peregrinibacteria bacterium]
MLIAEKKGKIVGVGRLKPLDEEVSELASLWVDPKFRGEGLGQELVLALLAKQKNGKVYALPSPELIDWYGALGFNEARDLPSELKNKTEACHQRFPKDKITVMIYRFIRGDGDKSFKRKPDLLVIDGGKGQLGVVVKALKNANLKIPVVSLAKREEEIFIPGKSHSLILPESSDELQLLQRLRDEAHRFALKYQRNLRGKRMLS